MLRPSNRDPVPFRLLLTSINVPEALARPHHEQYLAMICHSDHGLKPAHAPVDWEDLLRKLLES